MEALKKFFDILTIKNKYLITINIGATFLHTYLALSYVHYIACRYEPKDILSVDTDIVRGGNAVTLILRRQEITTYSYCKYTVTFVHLKG